MNKVATELFLLMSSLSQIENSERIISIFEGAINSYDDSFQVEYFKTPPAVIENKLEILSLPNNLGCFLCNGDSSKIIPEFPGLFQNAIQMLAVILERIDQQKLLSNEKAILQTIVDEKTRQIIDNEVKYRTLFENMKQGVFYQNYDGSLTDINGSGLKIFGISKEEFLARNSYNKEWSVMNEEGEALIPELHPSMVALKTGQPVYNSIIKIINEKTKEDVWLEINAVPEFKEGESRPSDVVVTMHNITEIKKNEIELSQSENRYRSITENSYEMVTLIDFDGKLQFYNNAFSQILGYDKSTLIGQSVFDLVIPEEDMLARLKFSEFVNNKNEKDEIVLRLLCKNGELKWVSIRAKILNDKNNNPENVLVIAKDITDQRKAEEQLNLQSLVFNQIRDNVTITDLNGVILDVNDAVIYTLGYSREELVGNYVNIYGEDPERGACQKEILEKTLGEGSWQGEVINYTNDGKEVILDCRTSIVYNNDGEKVALCGISSDLSGWKKTEKEINNLLERLNLAKEAAKLGIWDWDIKQNVLHWDERMFELYGQEKSNYNLTFEGWINCLHPEDRYENITLAEEAQYGNADYNTEFKIVIPDGSIKFIKAKGIVLRDKDGNPIRMTGVNYEITSQKLAEIEREIMVELFSLINKVTSKNELIREVLTFVKRVVKCEATGIRLKEKDDYPYYQTIGFSDKFVKKENFLCSVDIKGELLRDFNGNPVHDCMCGNIIHGRFDPSLPFFTSHGSFWSNSTTKLLSETSEKDRQARTRNRCNGEGYESVGLFPIKVGSNTFGLLQINDKRKGLFDNHLIRVLERICDALAISLFQFQTFEAMLVKDEIYREILQIALDGFWRVDLNGKILEVNQAWCNMSGYTQKEALKLNISDLEIIENKEEINKHMKKLIEDGGSRFESKHKCKNGNIIDVEISTTYSMLEKGQVYAFISDITQRKNNEVQLKTSLKEKEVLIRELYHRTKNNMQVICAILKLKAATIKEKNTVSILNEMENRIRSMALVHQKLYQSQNLSRVNLKDYISELTELLLKSYKIAEDKIKLIKDLERVEVLIDTAIPCGLIINELVSNSLKYAFPEGRNGEIRISVKKIGEGEIELDVSDNGVGIPVEFDIAESDSLGYQIIHGIANDQLQGTVDYDSQNGVRFKVRFKDSLYSERV